MFCSVLLSRAEVASSQRRMGGFLRMALAMDTRCFSPPESFSPRSPTFVLYLAGILSTMSCTCAIFDARRTSSSGAAMLP
mmetsp:Transcript_13762/g.54459  ORF Transcript_13762/g.54459 Transcript_13762/m.54459 type:complete len:80 (-) Transcript_13762:1339-1578(-)